MADPSVLEVRSLRRWYPGDEVAPLRQHLADGGVLIIPTESSYGLAVDPRNATGVQAVYRLKGREGGKPLPVVAADGQQILHLGVAPSSPGLATAHRLWPAPLTVVLPIAEPLAATAGSATLAVRIPAHPPLRQLLQALGCPLTATSANFSGDPPIIEPSQLQALMGEQDVILIDDGVLSGGAPSTLVRPLVGGVEVLRQGAFDMQYWYRAAGQGSRPLGDP